MATISLFQNAQIYTPEKLGVGSVLAVHGRVAQVGAGALDLGDLEAEVHDLDGALLVPGFMDNHVHVAGGGGASGYASRSRPLRRADFVGGSTTTVVGMLGFDSTSRMVRGLLADLKGLREAGLGAFALVGATRSHPIPTLTGSIADDIVYVDEVIGTGEVSISELGYGYDSFGSGPQYAATVVSETILAARLAGMPGYVCFQIPPYVGAHMASLFDIVKRTGIPRRHLLPSHVNQSRGYLEQAKEWGRDGGWVDVGTGYRPDRGFEHALDPCDAVEELLAAGVPEAQILLSSDGNGVVPNTSGKDVYMELHTLHYIWRRLVKERGLPLEVALQFVTSNAARLTGVDTRGAIAVGASADFVVLDDDLEPSATIVAGHILDASVHLPADGSRTSSA